MWTLASLRTFLPTFLSLATVHQCFIPSFFISSSTPPIHLSLGFSILLFPSGLQSIIVLRISSQFIFCTCPAYLSLDILTDSTMSGDLYSSLLHLILHFPLSVIGPYIFLNIFLSKTLSLDISNCVIYPSLTSVY